jgi:hypothetical protein
VIPFIFLTGTTAIVIAFVISLIAHFLAGAAKSKPDAHRLRSVNSEMTSPA